MQKGPLYAPEKLHEEYLQMSHPGYSALKWHHEHEPQEPFRPKWPQERNAEQSAPTNKRHTHCTSGHLGTTANQRYDIPWDWIWDTHLLARVHWGAPNTWSHIPLEMKTLMWAIARWRLQCNGIHSKEDPHYCIRWSTRNLLGQDQVQGALWKSSKSCHKTSNNQPWFTSLAIPWGFLAQHVLCGLNWG